METGNQKKYHLQTLRENLLDFDLVKCCMAHEKINRAADGFSPLKAGELRDDYQRATYCHFTVRSKRLACAHTKARNQLTDMLDSLPENVCSQGQRTQWKKQIFQLNLAIIQVDRKKSDAELAHARKSAEICAQGGDVLTVNEDLQQIDKTIQDLDNEHSGYVDHLSKLLIEILGPLDSSTSKSG